MKELQDQLWKLDFGVGVSIRYHAAARALWDRLDHCNKVLILLSGMSMVVVTVREIKGAEEFVGFFIGFLAILDIVFGFSERARQHDSLYRHFSRLGKDIASTANPTIEDLAVWRGRRREIETEEPSEWLWLNRRYYRIEAKARGIDKATVEHYLAS